MAVFRRRNPRPWWRRFGDWFWPHLGWSRWGQYHVHRLSRLSGSPHSLAAGFACGASASFTPFLGFHSLIGVGLAYVLRGNILVAVLGTVVGNPWTFPLIWAAAYQLGAVLLGLDTSSGFLTDAQINTLMELPFLDAVTQGFDLLRPYLAGMTLGGIILGTVSWAVFYWPLRRMIEVLQARRRARIARGAARQVDATGGEG